MCVGAAGISVVCTSVVCMCVSVSLSGPACHIYDILLNPDKFDLVFYGTRPGLKVLGPTSSISVAGCAINVSERLKILGVTLDGTLSFDDHITDMARSCNLSKYVSK